MSWPSHLNTGGRHAQLTLGAAAVLLLGPAWLLAVDAGRHDGLGRAIALGVSITLAVEGLFLIFRYGSQRVGSSLFTIAFYAMTALVLRLNSPDLKSPATHAMLGGVLLVPVAMFVRRELAATGSNSRHIKLLISQLLARRVWPEKFDEYRSCPLIKALREAVRENAGPALPLLAHDDVRMQMAILTALEFHTGWGDGQAEVVLQRAISTNQPAVRAAALLALANVTRSRHVQSLLPFLTAPSLEVRNAATIAVLWDAPNRWADVRGQIRAALAAPHAAKDGPLPCSGMLPPAALDDLVNWAVEAGPVGKRSTLTLVRHCKKAIQEDGSPQAIARVTRLVDNSKVPAAIRVELAHRLQSADVFPPDLGQRLIGPAHPTMLRVLAAGAVLHDHFDPSAVEVLREAAQQPNREITLAAANLIQKYLGVDLGLAVGGALPAVNSREAAEIARRVQKWASERGSQSATETPAEAIVLPTTDAAYF